MGYQLEVLSKIDINMGTMTEPLGFRERMPIFDEIANMADLSKL